MSTTGFLGNSPVQVPTSILKVALLIILSAFHSLRPWTESILSIWIFVNTWVCYQCDLFPKVLNWKSENSFCYRRECVSQSGSIKIFYFSRNVAMNTIEQYSNRRLFSVNSSNSIPWTLFILLLEILAQPNLGNISHTPPAMTLS